MATRKIAAGKDVRCYLGCVGKQNNDLCWKNHGTKDLWLRMVCPRESVRKLNLKQFHPN